MYKVPKDGIDEASEVFQNVFICCAADTVIDIRFYELSYLTIGIILRLTCLVLVFKASKQEVFCVCKHETAV